MKKKDNRGGARRGAGRKPIDGQRRRYKTIRITERAYAAIPRGEGTCAYVSALILRAASTN